MSVRQVTQDRAFRAFGCVDAVTRESAKVQKRYGTLARKLPGYLQVSGLGQTLAFLYAKRESNDTGERLLLDHLDRYLRDVLQRGAAGSDIMKLILGLEPAEYRRASRELMALAAWLKRFAEGRLGQEDD